LHEVEGEAGLFRALPVLGLTVPGDGHEHHVLAARLRAHAPGDLVAVDPRQADVEKHDLRALALGDGERGLAIVGRRDVVSPQPEQESHALPRVLVVVHDEDAQAVGLPRRRRPPACGRGRPRCREREPHHEFAALSRAFAVGGDRPAVQVHEPLHHREPDAQAALGSVEAAIALHEDVEDLRDELGAHSHPVVPAPARTASWPSRRVCTHTWPPSGVYLAALPRD
jgi:hypothetical protein